MNQHEKETNVNDQQQQEQEQQQQQQQPPIDVGIEATTLPLYDSKSQLINCSEELFGNIKNYITSEIECKHPTVVVLISLKKRNLCVCDCTTNNDDVSYTI